MDNNLICNVDMGIVSFEKELNERKVKNEIPVDVDGVELMKHIEEFTLKHNNMSINFGESVIIEGILQSENKVCIYYRVK